MWRKFVKLYFSGKKFFLLPTKLFTKQTFGFNNEFRTELIIKQTQFFNFIRNLV